MKKPVFTPRQMGQFVQALSDSMPPSFDPARLGEVPQVVAARIEPLDAGAVVQLVDRDDGTSAFLVNPVVAAFLIDRLVECGREAGWLDETLTLKIPRRDVGH